LIAENKKDVTWVNVISIELCINGDLTFVETLSWADKIENKTLVYRDYYS